jgi:RNA polymerase sigma factor (sigma-70 family)
MATALGATQLAPTCSEQELVAAVRAGDDRAFETLYARYRARIGAYILGMVHDHARAEDIAQDVFISALRRLRDTDRAIAFKPWLYEIAKNACIDEFRRSRRAREVPLDGDHDDGDGGSGPVIAGGATPDSEVENKQRLDDLRGAFHGLSESHHKIIVMREFAGLSYDEIGQRLGISKPMVESTLFRARRKLGEEYDELVSGRRCERVQSAIEAGGERPLLSLGLRERRQLARHLSHCQPCRRQARMAGVDESFFQAPTLIGKIAALFPIPAWLHWRRSDGDHDDRVGGVAALHPAATLKSVQVASRFADPASPGYGLGRATATAAAIVLAGAGAGFVAGLGGDGLPAIRAPHGHVAPATTPSPKRTTAHKSAGRHVRRASFGARKKTVQGTGGGAGGHGGSTAKSAGGGSRGAAGSGGANGGSKSNASTTSGSGSGSNAGSGSSGSGVTNRVKSVAGGAGSTLSSAAAAGSGAVSNVTQTASNVTNTATNTVNNTVSNVTQTASNVTNTATNTVNNTVSNVSPTASNVTNTATNTVNNTVSNAGQTASNVTNTASNTVNNTVSTASNLLPGH